MEPNVIASAGELIDALGGTSAVAILLNIGEPAVSNWRSRGFPPWTHSRLRNECADREIRFDENLLIGTPPRPRAGTRPAA